MAEKNDSYQKFVNECHMFYYYASKTGILDDQIRLTFHKMEGVSSPSIFKIGSSPSRHSSPYISNLEKKDGLSENYSVYAEKIARILTVIDHMENQSLQAAAFMIYINGTSFSTTADYYQIDRSVLTNMIRTEVKKSLQKTQLFECQDDNTAAMKKV